MQWTLTVAIAFDEQLNKSCNTLYVIEATTITDKSSVGFGEKYFTENATTEGDESSD